MVNIQFLSLKLNENVVVTVSRVTTVLEVIDEIADIYKI
jgi:hypothetical protein